MNRMGIRKNLIITFGGLSIISMICLGLAIYLYSKSTFVDISEESIRNDVNGIYQTIEVAYKMSKKLQQNNINAASNILDDVSYDMASKISVKIQNQVTKDRLQSKIPSMMLGKEKLYKNLSIIKKISNITSSTVTVFQKINQGYLRVTTNIVKKDGRLAIGTYIPNSSPVAKALDRGVDFIGRAYVVDGWYMTAYRPLKDNNGDVVGAVYTGASLKSALSDFIAKLKSKKILNSGYYYIVNSKGEIITHPTLEGKNVLTIKDANGKEFVKRIIKNKHGEFYHSSINRADSMTSKASKRYVLFKRFKEADWIIVGNIYEKDMIKSVITLRNITIIISLLFLGIIIACTFIMGRSISAPIIKISDNLLDASVTLNNISKELTSSAKEMSDASSIQASSLEETSASLEELSGMVKQNEDNNNLNNDIANKVFSESLDANNTMTKLEESMTAIKDSNDRIDDLVKIIGNIGEKTAIMDEIVFQTKLLSFNASVEAERAGEHGRGFAVVAQEVGNLAAMSGKAGNEISEIVKNSIDQAGKITKLNRVKVDEAYTIVSDTSSKMTNIMKMIDEVKQSSGHILETSKQQTVGIGQITEAMSQIDMTSQKNATTASQTSETGAILTSQSMKMNDLVTNLIENINGNV